MSDVQRISKISKDLDDLRSLIQICLSGHRWRFAKSPSVTLSQWFLQYSEHNRAQLRINLLKN